MLVTSLLAETNAGHEQLTAQCIPVRMQRITAEKAGRQEREAAAHSTSRQEVDS